jgi:hypothetical protein
MNKAKMAEWLFERIGGKISEIKNGYMSEEMLEMVGNDLDDYIDILKEIVKESVLP